jgi:FtsP/CotA-like multicopper oxidase with cupredoxin domain
MGDRLERSHHRPIGDAGRRDVMRRLELSRRDFLGLGAMATAGVAAGMFILPSGYVLGASRTQRLAQTGDEFFEPEVRRSSGGVLETTIEARTGSVHVAGQTATTSVYEGVFPAPTLWLRAGDVLRLRLVNDLEGVTNLHMHGFHVSPEGNSDNVLLHIMPGETFDYEFSIPANHPAGVYWYHPHFHGDSNEQVFRGLAGAVIIEGDLDRVRGVAGVPQRLLVLQALQLDADGSVTPPDQRNQERFQRLVNGQLNPTISIRPGETQRWRILNASASTFYNLHLAGHQFHQIAKDGNTLAEPWTRDQIVLGPGERVEVLIQGGAAGIYQFKSLGFNLGEATAPEAVLATLASAGAAVSPQPLPSALIPFDDLSDAHVDQHREITFQVQPNRVFQIDGKQFDETRVDQIVQLGATEEWVINNDSNVWHPFHIHVNDFQVVAVNGEPVRAHSYEDTTQVPPHGSVTMRTRFLDFPGKFVYHCHILLHEDGGMMGIVDVVAPKGTMPFGPATAGAAAANLYACDLPSLAATERAV